MSNHGTHTGAGRARRAGILLSLLLAAAGSANAQGWTRSGLDGKQIYGLETTAAGPMLAATYDGTFRSTDGGVSWTAVDTKPAYAVEEAGGTLYAAVRRSLTQDGLARSTDGGLTWQISPVSEHIRVMALDSSGGVLLGGMTKIHRSTDGGATWTSLSRNGMPEEFFDLMELAVGPGGMIVVGNAGITGGMIYGSIDEGKTWQELYKRQGDYGTIAFTPTGAILATFEGKAIRSTDYGANWTNVSGTGSGMLTAIGFRAGLALAAGSDGVYRSTDDGATWTGDPDALPTGAFPSALAFAADGTPVIATMNGILRNGPVAAVAMPSLTGTLEVEARPNPARDRTSIVTTLTGAARLRVTAFDARGERVATIADGTYEAGDVRIDWSTADVPAGIYRIVIASGDRVASTSVVVVR